ncbi:MAG: CPBP family intramembrane metalloprotease [Thermoleophilia bacterium]|nr:CPBP family intramembrane metalloprotease [Thermoleophilia bacterium]
MEATLPPAAPPPLPPPDPPAEPEATRDPGVFPFATWGPWSALGATVAALIAGLSISLPFIIVDGGDPDDFALATTIAIQICTAIGFIGIPFLLALMPGGGPRAALGRLGFKAFSVAKAAKWIAIGTVSYIVFAYVYSILIGTPDQDDIAGDFGPIPLQILMIAVIAPITEEVCFRGMLFGGIRTRLPLPFAALAAGAVFGLLHYSTGWSTVPMLIVFGAILAVVFEKTDSIWPAIIMHAMNNGIALVALNS